MDLQHNDKDMEKKLGSPVNRRPSDNLDYLPIKKRRPRLRSPSPPLQTPLDSIRAPHESVSDPKPLPSNSHVEVQKSLVTVNALVKTNLPHAEDSFAIELLAAAACKNNNVDDVDHAKVGVDVDELLTPQGTLASMDIPSLEKTTPGVEGENPLLRDSICSARNDSPNRIDSTTVSSDLLDKTENDAEKGSSSAKDVRLNWDLNTMMDEWEPHADDQNIGSTGNAVENVSCEGLHGVTSDKLHNSNEFKNSENAWRLLKCKSDIIISPAQVSSRSKYLDGRSSSEGSINTSTKLSMLARENFCFSGVQLGRLLSVKNVKLEKQDDVLVDPAVPDKSTCEMVRVKSEEEHVKLYDVLSVGNSLSKFTMPADVDSSSSKSEKAAFPNVLGDDIKITPSVNNLGECQTAMDYIMREKEIHSPPKVAHLGNSLSDNETKELMPKSYEQFDPPKISTLVYPSSDVETKELMTKSYEQFGPPKIATLVNPSSDVETMELMPKSYEQFGPPKIATLLNSSPDVETKERTPKSYEQFGPPKIATLVNPSSAVETKELMPMSYVQFGPPKIATLLNPSPNVESKELTPKSYEQFGPPKIATTVNPPPDAETKELMPKSCEQFGPPKIATLLNPSPDFETKDLAPKSYEEFGPPNIATAVKPPPDVETKELMPKSYEQFGPPKIGSLLNPSPDVETKELTPKSCEQFGSPKIATMVNPLPDVETKELMPKSYEQFGPPKVATPVNHSSDVETKELMPKPYERCGEVASEDPLGDGDISDLSLGGHDHFVHLEKVTKYPTGCESPFEDGEVRETDAFSWEENECETECVDYDIDDRDAYDFGNGSHFMSEARSESIQNEDNVNLTEKGTCGSAISLKESSTSASVENISGQDQTAVEANNSQTDEMVVSDSTRRLECKSSFTEEIRSRAMRAKWSSRVGESPASGALDKKNNLYMQPGRTAPRFQAGQEFRCDKYLGRDRHVPQMQDGRHKNNWNSSSSSFLESRNHFQNNYRRGGILPLPRSTILDSETDGEGLAYRDQRRSDNHSAKGVYRPLVRRRPLDNNDHACNAHRRNIESGDDGHGMIRGRFGIYHRGGFRGPRGGENHGPISNETALSSVLMPVRRRRSSSPLLNRNPSFSRPCRRSRSRSGTRSPIPWRLQEERSKGPRMDRTRIRYEDSKFEENDDAFRSPPRKRFSSQGDSKFFNDRNGGPSRFRERNSPGRFIGQRLRFDSRGSVERMNSDDGFRPRVHPQRFSKPTGEVWRGHNYDNNNNERTKYSNRRVGHNDNSGDIRRFRNDAEDCFDGHNNRNNNGWEGRGHFKYNRERM